MPKLDQRMTNKEVQEEIISIVADLNKVRERLAKLEQRLFMYGVVPTPPQPLTDDIPF